MFHIQTSRLYNKYSFIYLFSYLFLIVLNIIKYSNLIYILHISSISTMIFNASIFIVLFINLCLLFVCNSLNRCIIPCIITFAFMLFLIFGIKLVPLSFLVIYLMCYNAKLLNIKEFIKYNLIVTVVSFLFVVILHLFNIIPNIVIDYAGANKGNSLGFIHPNDTGAIVIGILLAILINFNYKEIMTGIKYNVYGICFLSLFITILFYSITHCRELLYFGLIVSILLLVVHISIIKSCIYVILTPIIIFIPSFLIYLDYNYNSSNTFYLHINEWLSSRIFMQNKIIYNYPITLLRRSVDAPVTSGLENTITLDNSFLSILETCGIVGLLIVGLFLIKLILMGINIDAYIPCISILALVIGSCVESSLFLIYLDSPLLYLAFLYYKNKETNKNSFL